MESSTVHSDDVTPHSSIECTSTRSFENAVDNNPDRSGTELQELFVIKQEIDCLQAELEEMNENDLCDSKLECYDRNDRMSEASVHPSLPPVHPVEYLNPTSSIVCSKRLEEVLAKDRGGLLEIPERPAEKMGRREEPLYGRLLLTTSAPVASLREIMDSTLTSLKSFLHTGRIVPSESRKHIEMESPFCIAKTNERKSCAEKQDLTALSLHMRRKKPRRERKLIRSQFGNARKRSLASITNVGLEEVKNRKSGETRKRTMSVVSATSVSSASIRLKIRIRKRIGSTGFPWVPPLEREESLRSISSSAENCYTHAKDNGLQQPSSSSSENVPLRSPIRIKIAPPKAPSTSCPPTLEKGTCDRTEWKSAEQTSFVNGNEPLLRVVKTEIDSDDDPVVVHEDMRSPEVRDFRVRSMATLEEEALVERLRKLMGTRFVDTSDPSWFRKLRAKAYHYTLKLIEQNRSTQELMLELETFRRYKKEELSRLERQLEQQARRSAAVSEDQQCYTDATSGLLPKHPRSVSGSRYESEDMELASSEDHVHKQSCAVHPITAETAASEIADPNASELDVTTFMPTASPCVSPPMRARKSLERIVEKLKSPHDDVPRDPAPSSAESVTSSCSVLRRKVLPFHRKNSPTRLIQSEHPSGARHFWNPGVVYKDGARHELTYNMDSARNRVAAGSHS